MASESEGERPDPASMPFEEATAELEAIIESIEEGEISLEESLVARRRGEALIRRSRAILDAAEEELKHVKPDLEDGGASPAPDPDGE